jgi:uncharacterized cupin superfamily protein
VRPERTARPVEEWRLGAQRRRVALVSGAFPRLRYAMADHSKIVMLDRYQTGESANPSPEKILAGIPRTRVSNQFTDGTQQFFCGIWTSTAGKWRVKYTEHEFCVLIEGRVRLESITGEKHEMRAGDAFVVQAGFEGTWEVAEPCKKWYAIFEARS